MKIENVDKIRKVMIHLQVCTLAFYVKLNPHWFSSGGQLVEPGDWNDKLF